MKKPSIIAITILLIFSTTAVYNQNNSETKTIFLQPSLASDSLTANNFTIVVLPDTQAYSQKLPWIFDNQTQWIANNIDTLNIAFVTQLGDLVEVPYNMTQWNIANQSMSNLDGKVPWSVLLGNHDVYNGNLTTFNTYFGQDRFSNEPWYGGAYREGDNSNSYQVFTAGEAEYLIFHIQYNPSDDVLFWANNVIDMYPEKKVIVSTHDYMGGIFGKGQRSEIGERIWHGLIKPNADQIILVLCGHVSTEDLIADCVDGNIVYQVLADYQGGHSGWLRILDFSPDQEKIFVKTFSPYLNEYKNDSQSEFTLDYQTIISKSNSSQRKILENQICIRSDGSIEPSNAPIEYVGNTYFFKQDIYGSLVIEKDDVVIDGKDFMLKGSGVEYEPFSYTQLGNYSIKVANAPDLNRSHIGIYSNSDKLTIKNLKVTDFWCGIKLEHASDNCIIDNEISNNTLGLRIVYSSNNTIQNNTIINNDYGIALKTSHDNIQENIISNNSKYGMKLSWSFNNISGNIFSKNTEGVCLTVSSHNLFSANTFQNNSQQVNLSHFVNDNINDGISLFDSKQPLINSWDDGLKGNYWSSYNGKDFDNNGLGDTPYIINENNIDRYPLISDANYKSSSIPEFPSYIILPVLLIFAITARALLRKSKGNKSLR